MIKRNTELIQDKETREAFEFMQENALGTAITLSAVPTADVPLIQANEWGVYAGVLYFRVENTIYVVTPSSTIAVA